MQEEIDNIKGVIGSDKMAECYSRECAVDKVLPNGEFKEFVHEQRVLNDDIKFIKKTMPTKYTLSQNIGIIITIISIIGSIVYGYGQGSLSISNNIKLIEKNETRIQRLEDNKIELVKVIATQEQMSKDIAQLKDMVTILTKEIVNKSK